MSLDGRIVGAIAMSGLFGFFALGMTLTSGKYILENVTGIDVLSKRQQYYLAVRVPLDHPSSAGYWTVTYPLPRPNEMPDHMFGDDEASTAGRDSRARRTFAIVQTQPGENPWDLGPWQNFKSVMGNNPLEWLLPIQHSPCTHHNDPDGDYAWNRTLIENLRSRYNLPRFHPDSASMSNGATRDKVA